MLPQTLSYIADLPVANKLETDITLGQLNVQESDILSRSVDRLSQVPSCNLDRLPQIPSRSVDRVSQLYFLSDRTVDDHAKHENSAPIPGNTLRDEPDRVPPMLNIRHHEQTSSPFDSVHSVGDANRLTELIYKDQQHNEEADKEEWMTDALLRDVSSVRLRLPRLMERV